MRKLPRWMTRKVALALIVLGAALVLLGWFGYGNEVIGSWCKDGREHFDAIQGACGGRDGIDRNLGDNGNIVVNTLVGERTAGWVGVTKWPARLVGLLGAVSGLVGLGATSMHSFGFAASSTGSKRQASKAASAKEPKPINEMGLLSDDDHHLDVEITANGNGYTVNVSTPIVQGVSMLHAGELPVDSWMAELNDLRKRPAKRRIGSKRGKAVEDFGSRLFESVFDGPTERAYRQSADLAREHNGVLRIALEVDRELAGVPWEYLHDTTRGTFLAMSRDTSLYRRWRPEHATRSQEPIGCVRILAMTASPRQLTALDVDGERARIEECLAPAIAAGAVELKFVTSGSLAALNLALKVERPHIFHFVGHGAWSDEHDDGIVYFEDPHGFPQPVTGRELGMLLNRSELRLAVFNSCDAARSSTEDRFAGVASSVVAQGVPAAIGPQFRFDDQAAITFGSTLLSELAAGASVDAALTDARLAVFTMPNDRDWGTPVLTTRVSPDAVLPRAD